MLKRLVADLHLVCVGLGVGFRPGPSDELGKQKKVSNKELDALNPKP